MSMEFIGFESFMIAFIKFPIEIAMKSHMKIRLNDEILSLWMEN